MIKPTLIWPPRDISRIAGFSRKTGLFSLTTLQSLPHYHTPQHNYFRALGFTPFLAIAKMSSNFRSESQNGSMYTIYIFSCEQASK